MDMLRSPNGGHKDVRAIVSCCAPILPFLTPSHTPPHLLAFASSIAELKKMVEDEEIFEALETVEEYTKCYAYMKTATLIFLLVTAWETFATRCQQVTNKAISKIVKLTADSKAEPEDMEAAQAAKEVCERGKFPAWPPVTVLCSTIYQVWSHHSIQNKYLFFLNVIHPNRKNEDKP